MRFGAEDPVVRAVKRDIKSVIKTAEIAEEVIMEHNLALNYLFSR